MCIAFTSYISVYLLIVINLFVYLKGYFCYFVLILFSLCIMYAAYSFKFSFKVYLILIIIFCICKS